MIAPHRTNDDGCAFPSSPLRLIAQLTACIVGITFCDASQAWAQRANGQPVLQWESLPPLPDANGFAGSFAGVDNGALVVAGGSNFPGPKPWQGGSKVWYDTVYVLQNPSAEWKVAGRLARPLAYGVSITTADGVACIGGSNADGHYAECFLLRWSGNKLTTSPLAPLPRSCANLCGAVVGNTIYVAGGLEKPKDVTALGTFWSLDLVNPEAAWKQQESWPGPGRMLATSGALGDSFYLLGGAALKADANGEPVREWLRDAFRFTPSAGWRRLKDLPRPAVAAPSPAPALGSARILVLGGDDGSQIAAAPANHTGFPRSVLVYDSGADAWSDGGLLPFSLVTTPCVVWNEQVVIPGGEARPGVRSNRIWAARRSSRAGSGAGEVNSRGGRRSLPPSD